MDDELRRSSFVVEITNGGNAVHELIRRNWCVIGLSLPEEGDRKAYCEFLSLSRGCRLRDIESIMRQAYAEGRRDDLNAVREAALVGGLLVVRKPSGITFDDVAGMKLYTLQARSALTFTEIW